MRRIRIGKKLWIPLGVLALWGFVAPLQAAAPDLHHEGRNFDARSTVPGSLLEVAEPSGAQLAGVERMRSELPDLMVSFDPRSGVTRSLFNGTGFLTGEQDGEPRALALAFAQEHLEALGLSAGDLDDFEITDEVYSDLSGTTHLYLRQKFQGIPVYLGQLQLNVGRGGRILSVNNGFVPGLASSIQSLAPLLDAEDAVQAAAEHLKLDAEKGLRVLDRGDDAQQTSTLEAPGLSQERIEARLHWLPVAAGQARLVWNFQVYTPDDQHVFDMTVDAETAEVWTRFDWIASDSYQVYQQPVESPNHAAIPPPADGRTIVVNPASAVASPFGWHDTNGVPGPEFTIMRGNNVHAYDDIDANNLPPAVEPNCGPLLDCNFPISLVSAPGAYTPASVANLFYWNNIVHDIQHRYGFNEAAGNFQVTNYTGAGLGNDDVRAEAQDGGGLNNANFFTPPDGSRPRMQMFLWNLTTPMRDGDLENSIIVHEYGHGISNRLVGGPSTVSCLGNLQQPGEGLSDWWSLAYTATAAQTGPTARGIGTYVLGQPTTGPGIRPLPYSTSNAVNNWTYASVAGMSVPHGVGAVWAQGAWEVYWSLVNRWGFSSNLANATGGSGNQRMMLYVNEGLKNTICSPAFTDVRDGIIQAAITNYQGEDVCRVWRAFAAFGLGTNAVSGGPGSLTPTNGFQVPGSCSLKPRVVQAGPFGGQRSRVSCPAGTRVAGGGCIDLSFSANLHAAWPLYSATTGVEGFACVHDTPVPSPPGLTAYAVCVRDPGTIGYNQIQATTPAGGGNLAVAFCPNGQSVIGGGCTDDSFGGALLNTSVPLTTPAFGIEGYACLYNGNPGGLTAYATCINSADAVGIQVTKASSSTATNLAAPCPGSTINIGGGCWDTSQSTNLLDPLPLQPFGFEGWGCQFNAPASDLVAYALCLAP